MTQTRPRSLRIPRTRELFFYLLLLFFFAMILKNPEMAVSSVQTGLLLCARSAIPSLFPFMVLSDLLTESGLGTLLGRMLGKPFARPLALPPEGVCALLLGLGCGFPVGVRSALTLYDNALLSKKQLERLLCFCNLPSSAFLVSAVGYSLYGNRRFGILLYCTCIATSLLIGIALGHRVPMDNAPHTSTSVTRKALGISTFTRAVSSATSAMLSVCAYILFFSSVIGCLSCALSPFNPPQEAKALLCGFLEMTSGTAAASAVKNPQTSAVLCALCVGFGGLSVHFQLLSFCEGRSLNLVPYFLAKLTQGVLCAAIVGAFLLLAPALIQKGESVSAFSYTHFASRYTTICLICFFICLLILMVSFVVRIRNQKIKKPERDCVRAWSW